MKVPRVLCVGDAWLESETNLDELRTLLHTYDIDIDQVYEIHFDENSMIVYRYAVGEGGRKYQENGGVVRQPAVTLRYFPAATPEVAG